MSYLEQWLLLTFVQTTVLLGSAAIVCRFFAFSPLTRHSLGVMAIALSCLAPVLSFVLPPTLTTCVLEAMYERPQNSLRSVAQIDVPAEFSQSKAQELQVDSSGGFVVPTGTLGKQAQSRNVQSTNTALRVANWLLLLWLTGSCLALFRRIAAFTTLRCLLRSTVPIMQSEEIRAHVESVFGKSIKVEMFCSDRIGSPCVIGLRRFRILLPTVIAIDGDCLKQVVTHECAHIHRRDSIVLLLQQIASILLWWQPLMRCLNQQVATARECIADMYVTSRSDALSYAETLLKIAEGCTKTSTLSALALLQPHTLEQRISDVLEKKYSLEEGRRTYTTLSIAVWAAAIVLCCGGVASRNARLLAQDRPVAVSPRTEVVATVGPESEKAEVSNLAPTTAKPNPAQDTRLVSGKVLDAQGAPLTNCRIIVTRRDFAGNAVNSSGVFQAGETASDERGHFSLVFPKEYSPYSLTYVWFYKKGHALKAIAFDPKLRTDGNFNDATIVLRAATPITVQVRDPEGEPAVKLGVDVATYCVSIMLKTDSHQGPNAVVPLELQRALRTITDEKGLAILTDFDSQLLRSLKIEMPEYGSQSIEYHQNTNVLNVRLSPTCPVKGQVHSPEPAKYAGVEFLLISRHVDSNESGATKYATARAIVDERGQFYVPAIACGELSVMVRHWPQKNEVLPVARPRVKMILGQTTQVDVELVKSVELTGKIVLDDGQNGAENVGVSLSQSSLPDPMPGYRGRMNIFFDGVQTDQNGNYRLYAPPGTIRIGCTTLGKYVSQYAPPEDKLSLSVTTSATKNIVPPIVLTRFPAVHVCLTDLSHRLIAGKAVILAAEIDGRVRYVSTVTTDDKGVAPVPMSTSRFFNDARVQPLFFEEEDFRESEPDKAKALRVIRREKDAIWMQRQ